MKKNMGTNVHLFKKAKRKKLNSTKKSFSNKHLTLIYTSLVKSIHLKCFIR